MIRVSAALMLVVVAAGCGRGGGGGGAGVAQVLQTSYHFDSKDSLPACDDVRKGALAYVADEERFYHCKETSWTALDITEGVTVASNRMISKSNANLCTQFATETCRFGGGQIVTLSDGTVIMTGGYSFIYVDGAATDYDHNTITAIIPPGIAGSYQVLSDMVARGSGYRRLFLAYQREPERVTLGYDANNNSLLDGDDTLLEALGVIEW